jgi:hypothetical protein
MKLTIQTFNQDNPGRQVSLSINHPNKEISVVDKGSNKYAFAIPKIHAVVSLGEGDFLGESSEVPIITYGKDNPVAEFILKVFQ